MIIVPNSEPPRRSGIGRVLAALVFLLLGLWAISLLATSPQTADDATRTRGPTIVPPSARDNVRLTSINGTRTASGTLWSISGTLENAGDEAVRDIVLVCSMTGNSGTTIDSVRRVVYERVPARGKQTFRNIEMGFWASQATGFSCTVAGAAWAAAS